MNGNHEQESARFLHVTAMRGVRVALLLAVAAAFAMMLGVNTAGPAAWASDEQGDASPLQAHILDTDATTVELYRVTVEGGIGGAVGVGDTLSAYATKLKTVAGSTTPQEIAIEDGDAAYYQWQYANTNTTSNSAFSDIEGATGVSYTITADMQGKYLRVKATSSNTVVSTSKPYSGTTLSVAPVGPVQAAAGAVEISSVSLVSTMANSMWVGSQVTPTAKYIPPNSYVEQPVPQGSAVTYTWKVADTSAGPFEAFDAAAFPQSAVSASGELTVGQDLLGKYVRVEANAYVNTKSSTTWRVLPAGVYDLLRITVGSGPFYTNETINTTLQGKTLEYENDASFGTTVPIDNPYVAYQWYYTADEPASGDDFSAATWMPIEGATEADLVVPTSVAGAYVKVVAVSGEGDMSTSVERVITSKVRSEADLSTAPERLEAVFFKPIPRFGEATNVNDLLSAKLEALGYEGVTVKTKSWQPTREDPLAHVGVSTADDETNGDVTFFYYDDVTTRDYHSFTSERQISITFELTRGVEAPVEYAVTVTVPWDIDKARAILEEQAATLALTYADGDSADSITQNFTLPCKAGFAFTTWASSNVDALSITGEWSFEDYTANVWRAEQDQVVVLTATVDGSIIDTYDDSLADLKVLKEFTITVKGDAEMIARTNAALAAAMDTAFAADKLTHSRTGALIDPLALDADMQLPTSGTLFRGSGLSSSDYTVRYSAGDQGAISVNGYRANVVRPLPGAGDIATSITLAVTHKNYPSIKFTKTIDLTVQALTEAEIDEDIAYMALAKANVFDGLSEGQQNADAVTGNLHPFQRAYIDDAGALCWQYNANDAAASKQPIGFTRETVAENPSSDAAYSHFVSSHPGVVADSTLYVTRPTQDLGVSVTCCLTSERFGEYYNHYATDPACSAELKEKFKNLYRQIVSCQFTVKGTQVSAAIREELEAEANAAEKLFEGVAVSDNGTDVPHDAVWVTADEKAALEDAITLARTVAARADASEADVADARAALAAACDAFESQRKAGTLVVASAELLAALESDADHAEALMAGVYASEDGSDVYENRTWAPEATLDRLQDAIDNARAIASSTTSSEAQAYKAMGELSIARTAFENAVKGGTKKLPPSASASSSTSSSSSSATSSSSSSSTSKSSSSSSASKSSSSSSSKSSSSSSSKSSSSSASKSSSSSSTASKNTAIGGVKAGKTYTAGKGATKARYLVKKAATKAANGTVWYKATKVSKASGKKAAVPATVKIKGGTYKVIGVSAKAFNGMKKLTKVTIGANVKKIQKTAFKSTPKLKTIVVKSTKLTKKSLVKGALKGAKTGKLTVKVPAKSKKTYKKVFTKKNLVAKSAVTVK